MTARNLRCAEQAQDSRALAKPQPFPLTGDGTEMERVWLRLSWEVMFGGNLLSERAGLAAAIVEARYRDWLAERRRG